MSERVGRLLLAGTVWPGFVGKPTGLGLRTGGPRGGPFTLGGNKIQLGAKKKKVENSNLGGAIGPAPTLRLCAKSVQSCPTLRDPMDHSLPGSSVYGGCPGKNSGVGTVPSSRGSSPPRD